MVKYWLSTLTEMADGGALHVSEIGPGKSPFSHKQSWTTTSSQITCFFGAGYSLSKSCFLRTINLVDSNERQETPASLDDFPILHLVGNIPGRGNFHCSAVPSRSAESESLAIAINHCCGRPSCPCAGEVRLFTNQVMR